MAQRVKNLPAIILRFYMTNLMNNPSYYYEVVKTSPWQHVNIVNKINILIHQFAVNVKLIKLNY